MKVRIWDQPLWEGFKVVVEEIDDQGERVFGQDVDVWVQLDHRSNRYEVEVGMGSVGSGSVDLYRRRQRLLGIALLIAEDLEHQLEIGRKPNELKVPQPTRQLA